MRCVFGKVGVLGMGFVLLLVFFSPLVPMVEVAGAFDSGDGSVDNPYVITDVWELQNMSLDLDAHYVLGDDIDASDTVNWNGGLGFFPIGDYLNSFTGSFDGQNHTISSLYINRPLSNFVGLFGYVGEFGSSFTPFIHNFGLVDCNVSGLTRVGSVAGYVRGSFIFECFSSGVVYSFDAWAGGFVGSIYKSYVDDCYSMCNLIFSSGDGAFHGGFVGEAHTSYLNYSYSTGSVSGRSFVGGFAGINLSSYFISCFYDSNTSGRSDNDGRGVPKTTEQMQSLSTFVDAGWDIGEDSGYGGETWHIDGGSYPILGWAYVSPMQQLVIDLMNMLPLIVLLMLFLAIASLVSFRSRY